MSCRCYHSLTLPRGAMCLSVVCYCGISWSYSLFGELTRNVIYFHGVGEAIRVILEKVGASTYFYRFRERCQKN